MLSLPIERVLPDLERAFAGDRNVVLTADPGAGKTTRVPIFLLSLPFMAGQRLIMLEPRRLAAQRAAAYMAQQLGEHTGESVGYRIRGDVSVGKATRIEVVTEGILTRMLQSTPDLPGAGLVIFDEFHERSIHADLGLALTLDVQRHLRNDLRILIMSATLDGSAVSDILGQAPVIRSEGKVFPVATHYLTRPAHGQTEALVVSTVMRVLGTDTGDLLVFLPGQREIRRVASQLEGAGLPSDVTVHMLFGDAPSGQQQAALSPASAGKRKVILSTSIAETSITIDGVRVVVDAGLSRIPRFDPRRGMSGLITSRVSKAGADQRRGRAGRQGPGVCYRLWTQEEDLLLSAFNPPEILSSDLAPLALELARWGDPDGRTLSFLDPPPPPHLSQARALLARLGALDREGKLTPHGKAMAGLPLHPRLAHMLIRGNELGLGALACDLAALLEDRDPLRGERDVDIDLQLRLHFLYKEKSGDRSLRERIRIQAGRLRRLLSLEDRETAEDKSGILLALAYPERIGKRRGEEGRQYQLSGGTGAVLPPGSLLARERYLAIGDVEGTGNEVRVYLAAPVSEEELYEAFADELETEDEVVWDEKLESVVARRTTKLGSILLSESGLKPPNVRIRSAMVGGILSLGLDALPWTQNALSLRIRSEWLRQHDLVETDWPDLSEQNLRETLDHWLGPYLEGMTRRAQLQQLDLGNILRGMFSFRQIQEMDRLAPTHLIVPTGSRIRVQYETGERPILSVRIQEMFGEHATPTVGGGRISVLLHLLSPASRPLAVTQDLHSFWKNVYPEVRKEMRGRYPKHYWPENPAEAKPTRKTGRKRT
jgi:ATP-dependent helicase HrpB